jgi:hypothetical protein
MCRSGIDLRLQHGERGPYPIELAGVGIEIERGGHQQVETRLIASRAAAVRSALADGAIFGPTKIATRRFGMSGPSDDCRARPCDTSAAGPHRDGREHQARSALVLLLHARAAQVVEQPWQRNRPLRRRPRRLSGVTTRK